MSGGKLTQLAADLRRTGRWTATLLEEGTRDLASYFQSQGYFDAMVSYTTSMPPNGQNSSTTTVDRGDRHISWSSSKSQGNHYFDYQPTSASA